MSKSSTVKGMGVLLLVVVVSFVAWEGDEVVLETSPRLLVTSYQTNPTRTSNVQKYCPASLDRTTLATTADVSTAQTNQNNVNSALGIDG
jgi:hypothetical protein